jgi:hypothetical protein
LGADIPSHKSQASSGSAKMDVNEDEHVSSSSKDEHKSSPPPPPKVESEPESDLG